VDRFLSHTSADDHTVYRSTSELEAMYRRDPIEHLKSDLIADGTITEQSWTRERAEIARSVELDYGRAMLADDPRPSSATLHTFSGSVLPEANHRLDGDRKWTLVSAVNETLRTLLAENERVLLFGEDIADPKGGVFGFTKGLSTSFPGRVSNSPLAEATIAGTAAGLAIAGYRPVFELQFIDFVGPAFNQIVNQIATLRWRTAGQWACPVTLYAPCGAYLPGGGPWHSQSNESWFAHVPGLRVVMPGTPYDAAATFRAALAGDDPVLILLPKHLNYLKSESTSDSSFSLGRAAVRRHGKDVTILAWGNCVEVALGSARELQKERIDCEVLDVRSIVPCDWNSIRDSIQKTGRLVVVQEDARSCSFGQAILAEVVSRPDYWNLLAGPPQLVSRPDVHIGFHAELEAAVLPSISRLCEAVKNVCRG
jgi:2-oxoisovalerate dehydrogenase E1 component